MFSTIISAWQGSQGQAQGHVVSHDFIPTPLKVIGAKGSPPNQVYSLTRWPCPGKLGSIAVFPVDWKHKRSWQACFCLDCVCVSQRLCKRTYARNWMRNPPSRKYFHVFVRNGDAGFFVGCSATQLLSCDLHKCMQGEAYPAGPFAFSS
jgi:hypothetical protein